MTNGVGAIEYHERTKHSPRSVRGGPGLDFDNKPRPDKGYVDRPSVPLEEAIPEPSMPALRAITAGTPADGGVVDRAALAGLCYYAAGITRTIRRGGQEHRFRAASCTGALYHVDLYPVCGDLPDLDAGVYHFDPRADALDVLREGDHREVLAAAAREPAVERAPVTFVATSTWWRNAWKYRERTYRHAFWDSGTVLANLLATATALDLPAEVVLGFADEPVATLLGVDPEWEAPLELVPVGAGDRVPDASAGAGAIDDSAAGVADAGAADPGAVDAIDPPTEPLDSDPREHPLLYEAWRASTLPDGAAAREWRAGGERPLGRRGPGDGDRVTLDPVGPDVASSRPLHDTVRRRGSCRRFVPDDLGVRKVSTVLDRATRGVPMDVRGGGGSGDPAGGGDDVTGGGGDDVTGGGGDDVTGGGGDDVTGGGGDDVTGGGGDDVTGGGGDDVTAGGGDDGPALQFVDCYCIVNGVEGVASGAYQYHPDAGDLELLHAGEYRQEAGHLALDQQLGADAAVCVYFLADLDAVTEALGDRGYRAAQLEAALTGGRLYLATYAHRDLGGTGLTFYDDAVTAFFEPRAAGQTPMFLYTLGRPA